jgi:hypothetical protein
MMFDELKLAKDIEPIRHSSRQLFELRVVLMAVSLKYHNRNYVQLKASRDPEVPLLERVALRILNFLKSPSS